MSQTGAIDLSKECPFFYAFTLDLDASAGGDYTLILGNDSEFDLQSIIAVTNQDASLTTNTQGQLPNNFSMLIKDLSSGRDFMSQAIQRGGICGDLLANTLNEGKRIRFPRKEQLSFTLQNLVAVPIQVQIILKGFKVFVRGPGGMN